MGHGHKKKAPAKRKATAYYEKTGGDTIQRAAGRGRGDRTQRVDGAVRFVSLLVQH